MVRYKNRYIAIQLATRDESGKRLNLKSHMALHEAINRKVTELYGEFGSAAIKAGFSAKYCNSYTKIALIKVRHGPHKFVLDAIPKLNDIGGRYVNVKVIYIGATIKHCCIFIKKYQRQRLEQTSKNLKNDNERKELEKALMTMNPAMKELIT